MSKNLYITAVEPRSGKSLIALGVMELLKRNVEKVGFFRPIINANSQNKEVDNEINLISRYYNLGREYDKMYGFTFQEARALITSGQHQALLEGILNKYNALAIKEDFVLCLGTDYESITSSFEFDINTEIANNLGCPILVVANAGDKSAQGIIKSCHYAVNSFEEKGCKILSLIINRSPEHFDESLIEQLKEDLSNKIESLYAVPNDELLGSLTMGEVATHLGADILYGENQLHRHISQKVVSAMHLGNYLNRVTEGALIITPSDRLDIIFGNLAVLKSRSMPNIAGMILTGNMPIDKSFFKAVKGMTDVFPILKVKTDTFLTTTNVNLAHSRIIPTNTRKIAVALGQFEKHVNTTQLSQLIVKFSVSASHRKCLNSALLIGRVPISSISSYRKALISAFCRHRSF